MKLNQRLAVGLTLGILGLLISVVSLIIYFRAKRIRIQQNQQITEIFSMAEPDDDHVRRSLSISTGTASLFSRPASRLSIWSSRPSSVQTELGHTTHSAAGVLPPIAEAPTESEAGD